MPPKLHSYSHEMQHFDRHFSITHCVVAFCTSKWRTIKLACLNRYLCEYVTHWCSAEQCKPAWHEKLEWGSLLLSKVLVGYDLFDFSHSEAVSPLLAKFFLWRKWKKSLFLSDWNGGQIQMERKECPVLGRGPASTWTWDLCFVLPKLWHWA